MACEIIGWCALDTSAQAAWAQAVLSFVGILIAVAVPAAQARHAAKVRSKENADRAASLGLYLYPDLQTFADRMNSVWMNEHPDHHVTDIDHNQCMVGSITLRALQIPERLLERVDELHHLGGAAAGVTGAVYLTTRARELITRDSTGAQIVTNKQEFYDYLWGALGGLTNAMNAIETSHAVPSRPDMR